MNPFSFMNFTSMPISSMCAAIMSGFFLAEGEEATTLPNLSTSVLKPAFLKPSAIRRAISDSCPGTPKDSVSLHRSCMSTMFTPRKTKTARSFVVKVKKEWLWQAALPSASTTQA